MRFGVLSDTHLYSMSTEFEQLYTKFLKDVDVLIHCGDFTGEEIYYFLNNHPKFIAVKGNCDFFELSPKAYLEVNGFKIAVTHGFGVLDLEKNPQQLLNIFPDADLICFGHTHKKYFSKIKNTYFLNPGTCQLKRRQGTFALLDWNEKNPKIQFVEV